MPKNIKGGSIEVEVTDKGSLKKLGRDAKRTGKDIGSVAKNTAESDRRLKSLSNQTSGASKAFSKQAQTISGGLVPVYATLAAQVFAVSAAFRFLQEASDFKNLVAGQQAYGAFTGTMYQKLAKDIRSATNSQISYTEASQAAAIGISAGLNATQLTALGDAAANTSLILGRDVTDSFNRLIRGVTKAEPELLDELGIVLRLDPALRNYAAAIGKTKEQLNAFERSQAVAAEVIGQAEEKFGGIQQIMDPSAFAFNQFAQAFNDLLDTFKVGLGSLAQTVLPFFTKNVGALVGALGLFALPILRQITPNFKALEEQSKSTITAISRDIKTLNRETKTLDVASRVAETGKGFKGLRRTSLSGLGKFGFDQADLLDKEGKVNQRRLAAFRNSAEKKIGVAKNMNDKELKQFKMHLRNLEVAEKASLNKRQRANTAHELKRRKEIKETQLFHARMQRVMTQVTQAGAKAMNMAFKAMGFLGLGLMVVDFGRMAIEAIVGVDEQAEKLSERFKDIAEATDLANDSINKMIQLRTKGLIGLTLQAGQAAKAIQSIGMGQTIQDINFLLAQDLTKARSEITVQGFASPSSKNMSTLGTGEFKFDETTELGKAIQGQIDVLNNLAELTANSEAANAFREYAVAIKEVAAGNRNVDKGFKDLAQRVGRLSNEVVELNQKSQAYSRTTKKVTEVTAGFLGKFAPATSSTKAIVAFKDNIDAITSNMEELQQVIDNAPAGFTGPLRPGEEPGMSPERREAQDKFDRFEAEKKQNEFLLGVLQKHSRLEAAILVDMEQQKKIKAKIVQDGSVIAALGNQEIAKDQKKLQIQKLLNDITHQTEIINAKGEDVDEARRQNAQNSKEIAEAKLGVLQAELDMMDRLLFMDKARADLELKRKTGGFASGFGLFGNITSDQIASTMTNMGMTEAEAIAHLQNFNMEMKLANMELDIMENLGKSVGNALTDGLANAFIEVAKGTTTFADAFRQMTIKVLADIAAMTMKMAIFKMIAGFFTPGTRPGVTGMDELLTGTDFTTFSKPGTINMGAMNFGKDARSGGIMSSRGRSYGHGGIATGPDSGFLATLHGTEAVVPLGNDRSIPVELKGASGGINNITVNVNGGTEGGGQSPEQGKALGQMIQVATMEIIQREKRPGGVLSR